MSELEIRVADTKIGAKSYPTPVFEHVNGLWTICTMHPDKGGKGIKVTVDDGVKASALTNKRPLEGGKWLVPCTLLPEFNEDYDSENANAYCTETFWVIAEKPLKYKKTRVGYPLGRVLEAIKKRSWMIVDPRGPKDNSEIGAKEVTMMVPREELEGNE
jgi:hypothetical protein